MAKTKKNEVIVSFDTTKLGIGETVKVLKKYLEAGSCFAIRPDENEYGIVTFHVAFYCKHRALDRCFAGIGKLIGKGVLIEDLSVR